MMQCRILKGSGNGHGLALGRDQSIRRRWYEAEDAFVRMASRLL